jgi:hypothetical protein
MLGPGKKVTMKGGSTNSSGSTSTSRESTNRDGSGSNSGSGSVPIGLSLSLLIFGLISCLLFVYHELHYSHFRPPRENSKLHQLHQIKGDVLQGSAVSLPQAIDPLLVHSEPRRLPPPSDGDPNDDAVAATTAKPKPKAAEEVEARGDLVCNGKPTDSEVIYWKKVPGDETFESPITPHHGYCF